MTAETALRPQTTITVANSELQTLRRHAERRYPKECCGVLVGCFEEESAMVIRVVPTVNQSRTRAGDRYEISPQDVLRVTRRAARAGAEVVGYYHSHPDRPAVPSAMDEATAWPGVSYVIVAVVEGSAGEVRSWRLCDGELVEEMLLDNAAERRLELAG